MAVSESISRFLIVTLQHHHNLQLRYEIASFTHNRAGTNVFAFVASHADWFPIQRKTTGNDEPPSRKIELVDAGAVEIYDLLAIRSEEHTSELQSLMRISYAVFCLKKKNSQGQRNTYTKVINQHYDTIPKYFSDL